MSLVNRYQLNTRQGDSGFVRPFCYQSAKEPSPNIGERYDTIAVEEENVGFALPDLVTVQPITYAQELLR